MKAIGNLIWLLFATAIAMVGYSIHHSVFWSVMDFVFSPLALVKWLICQEITWSVVKATFAFLAN